MSKLNESEKQALLHGIDGSGSPIWTIFDDLADQLKLKGRSQGEDYLGNLLRPQEDGSMYVDRTEEGIKTRQRLDDALDSLTLLEIAFELRIVQPAAIDRALLAGFATLVDQSEAFLRYANAYLYFGVRMFACRFFPMNWSHKPLPSDRAGVLPNTRWFPVAFPPEPQLPHPDADGQGRTEAQERAQEQREIAFADYLQHQRTEQFKIGLRFLDGFYDDPGAPSSDQARTLSQAEAAQYELWLRGLLPPTRTEMESKPAVNSEVAQPWMTAEGRARMEAEAPLQAQARAAASRTAELQDQRFDLITRQLIDWIKDRVGFYSNLQQQVGRQLVSDDELITNPVAARFALADIYWIARLLRAEVSPNAAVSYPRVSWLHILRFRATLDGLTLREKELRHGEEILRSVFDFVCDLVQNAVEISQQEEQRACNPDAYPKEPPSCTLEWRQVFDDELSEIERQRRYRTFIDLGLGLQQEGIPCTSSKAPIWSQRIITGLEPHARIGLAFSGGGIRSATFNLGVLQGLQEFDLLGQVDYLSTVSGGGFIGAWLTGNVQRTRHWLGKATCWDESVNHLRLYASYLAPLTGILSADTWTLAATWIRNTFLVQLSGLVWVFIVLAGTLLVRKVFVALAVNCTSSATAVCNVTNYLPYTKSIALLMGMLIVATFIYNFIGTRVQTGRNLPSVLYIRRLAVLPSWIGVFMIASMIWSYAAAWNTAPPSPLHLTDQAQHVLEVAGVSPLRAIQSALHMLLTIWHAILDAHPRITAISKSETHTQDYSFILRRGWQWLFFIVSFHWVAMLLIGWFALKPALPARYKDGVKKAVSRLGTARRRAVTERRASPDRQVGARSNLHLIECRIRLTLARAHPYRTRIWRSFWIGSLCMVVLYLAICAILYLEIHWPYNTAKFDSYAFVFGPALVLSAFTLSVVLFIGLSGRRSNEAQREWWTRFGAWLNIFGVVGLLLAFFAVFGPKLFIMLFQPSTQHYLRAVKWGAVLSGIGTVIGGLFAGNSSKTSGEGSRNKSRTLELLAKLGGLVFVIGAAITAAAILHLFLLNFVTLVPLSNVPDWDGLRAQYWTSLANVRWLTLSVVVVLLSSVGFLFSYFFEINIFGLSQFYRNRLVRCYLGATRWAPGIRKPHPFTKFDFHDDMPLSDLRNNDAAGKKYRGPFPIFNCTLNLAGSSDLALHTRHSASFSLTPLHCGADRPLVGYAPTGSNLPQDAKSSFAGGVMLGQAVAISGAAASPNMGYNTSPLVALLLTMFNVRLGWWFPNPGRKKWNARGLSYSLYYLTRELLGMADETQHFLNVSDGGHFENLGVYELIRRRCKVILACDAECDEVLQFGGLGNLVRICATDFGATIDIDVRSIREQKEGFSLSHCTVGLIKYNNGSLGRLIYFKASVTGDEDIGTAQYRSAHPSFPHETTANQFFSEDQFESYRKLGRHVVAHSLRGTQPGDSTVRIAEKLADMTAPARSSGDAFLRHTKRLEQIWEQFRKSPALHSFVDELMHINPPIAVVPADSSNAHEASEELCMALELIQLMEDVFIDLQLDDFWEHPDNRGWAILFMRWARSPRFQKIWSQTRRTFGIRFEYFCQSRLGLTCDKPIVRV